MTAIKDIKLDTLRIVDNIIKVLIARDFNVFLMDKNRYAKDKVITITVNAIKDYAGKYSLINETKHDIYDSIPLTRQEETVYTDGSSDRLFLNKNHIVNVSTVPDNKLDFKIAIKELTLKPFKSTSTSPNNDFTSNSSRITYRLPSLKRGQTGTGKLSVHCDGHHIGNIYCEGDDHDENKPLWKAELHAGTFNHLKYEDEDNNNTNKDRICYDKGIDDIKLVTGQPLTLNQSKLWVNSIFSRKIWEAGLVGY